MFKSHIIVVYIMYAEDKFLVVEEAINGKILWNQSVGHPEADETLVQTATRELWEETGIEGQLQHFARVHQ